jgi:hypothetical protein
VPVHKRMFFQDDERPKRGLVGWVEVTFRAGIAW